MWFGVLYPFGISYKFEFYITPMHHGLMKIQTNLNFYIFYVIKLTFDAYNKWVKNQLSYTIQSNHMFFTHQLFAEAWSSPNIGKCYELWLGTLKRLSNMGFYSIKIR